MHQFGIYVGAGTCDDYGIGFSGHIVLHLCKNVEPNKNHKVFTDIFFFFNRLGHCSLKRRDFHGWNNQERQNGRVYPLFRRRPQKKIKNGRGSEDHATEMKCGVNVIKWLDKKPIHFISSYTAVEPMGECQRWSEKISVPRPDVVNEYI